MSPRFPNSWKYMHEQLLASRAKPPDDPPPPDPPSDVQTVLQVDMAMLEAEPDPPARVGRGWIGRFVGNAVTAGVKAAETVGTAVGETVLSVRDRMQKQEQEPEGLPGAEDDDARRSDAPAAAAAPVGDVPRFKTLFGRVADTNDHASPALVGERLHWVRARRRLPRACCRCCCCCSAT
jgi:hypothetical protein